MTIKYKENRKIYCADKGKRVRFVNDKTLYSEISVKNTDTRQVEEVDSEEEEEEEK